MGLVLTAWNLLMFVMIFLWPLICLTDCFLRNRDPYKRRMQRGKFYRWEQRTFGPVWACVWEVPVIFAALGMSFALNSTAPIYLYWIYVAIVGAVDWITGSDDPPYRRWVGSLSKKLTINPPPRPVIDLSCT